MGMSIKNITFFQTGNGRNWRCVGSTSQADAIGSFIVTLNIYISGEVLEGCSLVITLQ